MGWFWDDEKPPGPTEDPYSRLDPALRDFLNIESPLKYEDTKPRRLQPSPQPQSSQSSPNSASTNYRAQLGWDAPESGQRGQSTLARQDKPAVPPESLFQDGRYADLWKTYRPQSDIDAVGKTDQDRLADIVDAFKDRKAAIGRAAVENCVMEQMAERDCWENGTWAERMKMCRGPNREFLRCYTMQSRFLKALGYLSTMRSEEEEERIQMHADKLYHEMLERESRIEEAKKAGLPEPEMPPLISPERTQQVLGEESAWARARHKAVEMGLSTNLSAYTPEKQEKIMQKIKSLSPREQELELQLIAAESRAQLEYAQQIRVALEKEREARLDRRERGKETVGDTIKRLWGWDRGG